MKTKPLFYPLIACLLACGLANAQTKPRSGFEQLKALVGEWVGTTSEGTGAHVSYQLVSGGTALLERLEGGTESEMITIYTADGDRVAVTHYCNANNQPQMRTAPIAGETKEFSFDFVRATNLKSLDEGHMNGLVVTLHDKDHFTQTWSWQEKGKTKIEMFRFTRKI
jgi:hypothetical protein